MNGAQRCRRRHGEGQQRIPFGNDKQLAMAAGAYNFCDSYGGVWR